MFIQEGASLKDRMLWKRTTKWHRAEVVGLSATGNMASSSRDWEEEYSGGSEGSDAVEIKAFSSALGRSRCGKAVIK